MRGPVKKQIYCGIDQDQNGGMTMIGQIIKDGWIFELIPENETCEGWDIDRLAALQEKIHEKWQEYGFRVNNLPPELRQRHERIHAEAIERAHAAGWDPSLGDDD